MSTSLTSLLSAGLLSSLSTSTLFDVLSVLFCVFSDSDAFCVSSGVLSLFDVSSGFASALSAFFTRYSFSNSTIVFPANSFALNVNSTSTVPSAVSGVNTASAVISLPPFCSGFLLSLSITVPATLYVRPGIRFLYVTVSFTFTSSPAFDR